MSYVTGTGTYNRQDYCNICEMFLVAAISCTSVFMVLVNTQITVKGIVKTDAM